MNGTAEGYSIYCCAAIFVDIIQNNIKDWDKVKEMYHWYANNIKDIDPAKWYIENNNLPDETKISDQAARLYMFIGKLSEYGETNVMALIKEDDFKSMLAKCGG